MNLPPWQEIDARMRAIGAPATASETHGVLCGLLCMGERGARAAWLRQSLGTGSAPPPLDALYGETLRQLDDATFDFQLLLPDDDTDLAERTAALADWCGGFSFGVGLTSGGRGELPAEAAEFVGDVTEIARASIDDALADDTDEEAYAEVVEYVRMGALLVRTECGARAG